MGHDHGVLGVKTRSVRRALLSPFVVEAVMDLAAGDAGPQRRRQGTEGIGTVGEQRVPAVIGDVDGVEHDGPDRVLACRRIRMEEQLTIAGATSVDAVGDVVDRRRHGFAGLHGLGCRRLRGSEPARESQLLVWCDGLVPEEQQTVLEPHLVELIGNRRNGVAVQ